MNHERKELVMLRSTLLGLILVGSWTSPGQAQWRVGVDLGADRIARVVRSGEAPDGTGPDGRPTMTWPVVLRIEHGREGLRVGISGSVVRPGLELIGPEFTVTARPAFRVLSLAAEFSARAARLPQGGSIRVHLGVPAERWSFPGYTDPPRWRIGIAGGAALEVPLAARLSGRFGVALGTLFASPLSNAELTDEYATTPVWRESVRAGLVVRL